MSQTNLKKAFSKLRFKVGPPRRCSTPQGPQGRLDRMRKLVTALVKHERLEVLHSYGDESRGYAERLISDAIRYGENHKETMEMASYWLLEKQLVHKLFKVLVPRYQDCSLSYTKLWKAPTQYPGKAKEKCVLELRGNIYPSLVPNDFSNHNLLHNVLLAEAQKEYETEVLERKAEQRMEMRMISIQEAKHEAQSLQAGEQTEQELSNENKDCEKTEHEVQSEQASEQTVQEQSKDGERTENKQNNVKNE